MNPPSTDDDLGARLRSALQKLSPLATDPLPPPRFAPTAVLDPIRDRPTATFGGELVETGTLPRVPRVPRRKLTIVAALLAVAATAVIAVVQTTDLRGGRRDDVPASGVAPADPVSGTASAVSGPPYLGVVPDPVPWRCTAPAGHVLQATFSLDALAPQVWSVGPGTTCGPFPDDVGRFVISSDGKGVTVPGIAPATFGVASFCATAASQVSSAPMSFVSRGANDYLEFYGPGCRLVPGAR